MIRSTAFVLLLTLACCRNEPDLKIAGDMWNRSNEDGYVTTEAAGGIAFSLSPSTQSAAPVSVERKLIKTGSIEFEVNDIEAAKKSIADLVREAGGYISSDNQNNNFGSPRFEQVTRIPSDKLDEFIAKIEGLAKRVDSKNISTQDVTEEFIDVQTRLGTKKELEARYREILKQAKTVKDILEVETQLNNVRGEIESMEGRLKYLTNQVSYSTLTISYYQTISGNYGFGYRFLGSFGNGWDNFLDFLINIFETWPFIIIGGVLTWLFIRWRRKRKAQASQS